MIQRISVRFSSTQNNTTQHTTKTKNIKTSKTIKISFLDFQPSE
jgi:hypothetical protein